MNRRIALPLCLLLVSTPAMRAQTSQNTGILGSVTDPSGAVVQGADVVATNSRTGKSTHVVTDDAGTYRIAGLTPGVYRVTINRIGFRAATMDNVAVQDGQMTPEPSVLHVTASTSIDVIGDLFGVNEQPSQQEVFESDQQLRVIDRQQIETAGPVAGAAQIVALTPGANVTGYGNTGATKYTIGVNGVSQGWGGYGGYSGGGALAVTLDGVPIADPATNLWQSPTIPEEFLIQNVNVTYGPGDPADRWFNNVGGGIEFTPVQPQAKPHADIQGTYGSFNQKDLAASLTSGIVRGWSAVLGGGVGSGNDFRNAPDGFQNPSKDVAVFSKILKSQSENTFELGGYYAHGAGYRSQVIPVAANSLITMDGTPTGQQYSQQTSGYFSTLPYLSYNKYDTNEDGLVYGRERVEIDPEFHLENLTWFNHIARSHYRLNDVYSTGPQQDEWNSPHTNTVGNRLLLMRRIGVNNITVGGYFLSALYNSRNNFYNPADGGAKRIANIGGKVRSSNFDQNDYAVMAQDELRFGTRLTVTPGIRYVGFRVNYSDNAAEDFQLAPNAVLTTHCAATQTGYTKPVDANGNAVGVKDQGSNCGGYESRSGAEPSINGTVRVLPWLQVFGGFMESLRAPQLGGGGGLFQSVDPASYHLSRQNYAQVGFKVHQEGTGMLNSVLLTGTYYHQAWNNQEIDTTLANGNAIAANGSSVYQGFNASFDDNPISTLHVFVNFNAETATYSKYETVVAINSSTPEQNFNGLHVPYVPKATLNAGAFYNWKLSREISLQPMLSFQFTGPQYIFNNNGVDAAGNQFPQPSNQTMPSYATVNAAVKVPFRKLELGVNAINLANNRYNIYQYISSGGYFGTAGNGTPAESAGYQLAYPGAPISVYGTVAVHF